MWSDCTCVAPRSARLTRFAHLGLILVNTPSPTHPFQRLTGVPLASGALSVFGFCGFLRKFCGILRIFAEFYRLLLIFAELLRKFAELSRNFAEFCWNFAEILRTNTKGTRAKGHQCEALNLDAPSRAATSTNLPGVRRFGRSLNDSGRSVDSEVIL